MIISLIWIIVFFILVSIELSHPGLFYALSAALASFLCALLSGVTDNSILQLVCFLVSSIIIFLLLKKYTQRLMQHTTIRTNCDRLIGKRVIVHEAISAQRMGTIKIYGDIWPAASAEGILEGDIVEVISYSGNHFIVKKVSINLN